MKGFNKTILMGNITKDVDMRTTPNGQSVANFTLAVTRTWKNDGETQEQTSFIPCVAWGKTGEVIAKYVGKGSPLLVSGRLDQRTYDDPKSGNKRSVYEVSVEDFNFISNNNPNDRTPMTQAQALNGGRDFVPSEVEDAPISLSEIPF